MKILFLHRDLPPDSFTGVAIQVHRLANALTDLGHDVSIYTHTAQSPEARYRILPIRFAGLRFVLNLAPILKRLWYPLWYRCLDMRGFDAVHIHGDGGFLKYRPNFIRTFYGTAALELRHSTSMKGRLAQWISYRLERREARRCKWAVGISPHIARHLPGVDRVIPCMLPQDPDAAGGVKTAYPSIVYLGSRHSRKRGEAALELFERLSVHYPDLRMAYVGPAIEVEELAGLEEYRGVEFFTRLGQDEIIELYRKSWIYLCLSSYEGFGVGIIEAMAHSCVVVSARHPGSEYLIADGETGFVSEPGETQALLARIMDDADARAKVADNAREFAKRFAPSVVASAYAGLYEKAMAHYGAPRCK